MRGLLLSLAVLAAAGCGAAWWLTRPQPIEAAAIRGMTGDAARGGDLFTVAGCASCHVAPDAEEGEGDPVLAGGQAFETQFGTFHAPNISSGPAGIGEWSDAELVSAMARGVAAGGAHLYPALPYTSYENADLQDLVDIAAHLRTLPGSDAASRPNELSFPYNIRRGLGAWKRIYAGRGWVLQDPADPGIARGRYLVEALAHCGQCHTPRTALGGMDRDRWLQGAENPDGDGRIPGIAPGQLDWSDGDIAAYLTTGLTPDYDSAGGNMVSVIENLSTLPDADIEAIVAYLRAIPAADGG